MTKKEMMLLDTLETQFKCLTHLPTSAIPRLKAIIHQAPDEALLAMVKRKIRFCDTVATSELVSRGIFAESAKLDHAVDILMENHV